MEQHERLAKAKELRDQGLISEREFEAVRGRILGGGNSVWLAVVGAVVFAAVGASVAWYLLTTRHEVAAALQAPPPGPRPAAATDASSPEPIKPSTKPDVLRRVFDPDMLGAEIAYLESIIGPARIKGESSRDYRVDGCDIEISLSGSTISGLGMTVSKNCSFNLDLFFTNGKLGQANSIKLGDASDYFLESEFTSDCIYMCGNGQVQAVYMTSQGSHADSFFYLTLETSNYNSGARKWKDAMMIRGEEWLISGSYNCDRSFDRIAARAFRQERPYRVTVSSSKEDGCQGKQF